MELELDSLIKNILSEKERILKFYETADNKGNEVWWYATNRRVLKFAKSRTSLFGRGNKEVQEMPYKHITSISFKAESHNYLSWIGGVILFIGIFLFAFKNFITIFPNMDWYSIVGGIIIIILGFFFPYKSAFYQFTGAGINQPNWTVFESKSKKIEDFISVVRKHIVD